MIDTLKPGQQIRCTITSLPLAASDRKTLERLMRKDPTVVRGLKRSAVVRARQTVTYNRGNRDWVQRRKCGKIVRVVAGNSWACIVDANSIADFKAVGKFLKIDAA